MLATTNAFVDGLEKWIKAMREGDLAHAKDLAAHCSMAGDLLAIHPDFIRCFKAHRGVEPRDVLPDFSQFLQCAMECRNKALQKSRHA